MKHFRTARILTVGILMLLCQLASQDVDAQQAQVRRPPARPVPAEQAGSPQTTPSATAVPQQAAEQRPFVYRFQPGGTGSSPPSKVEVLYRSLGEHYGVTILFDDKLNLGSPVRDLEFDLDHLTLEQALERLAVAADHFYKKVDESTYFIADDTPQNRREYEDLVIRLFAVENVPVKEIDKMVRSLIEARRVSVCQETNTLMMRDTADKMKIAARLVDLLDRPASELRVQVEVLSCDPGLLREALHRIPQQAVDAPPNLTPEQLEKVRRAARTTTLATTWLGVMGTQPARYQTRTEAGSVDINVGGSTHGTSHEATLVVSVLAETLLDPDSTAAASEGDTVARRMVRSSFRLPAATTALITGLGAGDQELAVALTPTVIRTARYDEADLEALLVGTESRISFEGGKGIH